MLQLPLRSERRGEACILARKLTAESDRISMPCPAALERCLDLYARDMLSEARMNRIASGFVALTGCGSRPEVLELLELRRLTIEGRAAAWAQGGGLAAAEAEIAPVLAGRMVAGIASAQRAAWFGAAEARPADRISDTWRDADEGPPKAHVKGGETKFGTAIYHAFSKALEQVFDGNPRGFVMHSFRHYVNDRLSRGTAIPKLVRIELIGHEGDDTNERVYRRSTSCRPRSMPCRWSMTCCGCMGARSAGEADICASPSRRGTRWSTPSRCLIAEM